MAQAVDLRYPFEGRWVARNSPADRVPSHGTPLFATSFAIDFVPVDASGRSARMTVGSLLRPEPPERFVGFGRPVLSPVDGVVVGVTDAEPDHEARRGLPSVGYALTQGRRAASGWAALAGNSVLLALPGGGPVVGLCHLMLGSVRVRPGEAVVAGQPLARCGNSGNSTEPHVHLQAMDGADAGRATAVPVTFNGRVPRNGEVVEG